MRPGFLLPVLTITGAAVGCTDDHDTTPIITSIAVPRCTPSAELDELDVTVQGTVVDFLTGEPLVGVTVDVARAWEPQAVFPADSCSVATLTTDAAGRFGPLSVKLGPSPSLFETKFVVFLAQGAGISPTASDNRVMTVGNAMIDHTLTAPSLDVMDVWRADLDDGGMSNARTRGLIAFRYDDGAGAPAAGVTGLYTTLLDDRPLERGDEVRYLSADRATLEPVSQAATTASGLALIGVTPSVNGTRDVGGLRGSDSWGQIGCLVGDGWLFLEQSRPIAR